MDKNERDPYLAGIMAKLDDTAKEDDMATLVNLTVHGDVVADSKAIEYARAHIGKGAAVGTSLMLDAFRVLVFRGEIRKLQVCFEGGDLVEVDKNGTLEYWPDSEIADVQMSLSIELAGFKKGDDEKLALDAEVNEFNDALDGLSEFRSDHPAWPKGND